MRRKSVRQMAFGAVILFAGAGVSANQDQEAKESANQDEETQETQEAKEEKCTDQEAVLSFTLGSSNLDGTARAQLEEVAQWLLAEDDRSLRVEGYADPSGSTETNQKLSGERAHAVEKFLQGRGIDADRVEMFGRGERPADIAPAAITPDQMRIVVIGRCEPETKTTPVESEPAAPAPPPPTEPPPAAAMEPYEPAETVVAGPAPEPGVPSGFGISLMAGGGVTGFFDEETRSLTDPGGSWEVRAAIGTRMFVGIEAAYLGSAQNLETIGLESDALLVGNGVEGALRLQIPTGVVRPYLFGGIGWTHYELTQSAVGASGINSNDDVGTFPFGVGVAFVTRGFVLDVRGTARPTFDDGMLDSAVAGIGKEAQLHNWGVTARLGAEF